MERISLKTGKLAALLVVMLAAAFLRLYRLDQVPPGWRDDELINSLVISQHVLDGEWALFYPDASGHEALYHSINAAFLKLFSPGVPGIRWLSVLLGILSVALTIQLGRSLFGFRVGIIAGIGLSASFWSLMYSRIGLRHISLLPFMLGAWLALWKGIRCRGEEKGWLGIPKRYSYFILTGVLLGINFYTYFASRGLPLVLIALGAYWLIFDRESFRCHWKGILIALIIAGLLFIPLGVTLAKIPEMTGRVEELAVPLVEAKEGNITPLVQHILSTLSMFHATGDDEWLYNIPYRPVFNTLGAIIFLLGFLCCLRWMIPRKGRAFTSESAFILIWLFVGLAPAFVSVPPASFGHTIISQPCAYLLPAIGIMGVSRLKLTNKESQWMIWISIGIAAIFLASNVSRDLQDYFHNWPERGMVRFLYRGNIHDATGYLNDHPDVMNVAFSGSLAGPWDRQAFLTDMKIPVFDRWFDPSRTIIYPSGGGSLVMTGYPKLAGELEPIFKSSSELVVDTKSFGVYSMDAAPHLNNIIEKDGSASFRNGVSLVEFEVGNGGIFTKWSAQGVPSGLPRFKLISNPPPPGIETRPRLAIFVHCLSQDGSILSIDDGLWVDPYTLQPDDIWIQYNVIADMEQTISIEIGIYDPVTDTRVVNNNGSDRMVIPLR